MKVYIVTAVVLDFEDYGPDDIRACLDNVRGFDHLYVEKIEGFEIGGWSDDHPLNQRSTDSVAWLREHGNAAEGQP